MQKRRWTEEEKSLLRDLVSRRYRIKGIAKHFPKRTLISIKQMLHRLGLLTTENVKGPSEAVLCMFPTEVIAKIVALSVKYSIPKTVVVNSIMEKALASSDDPLAL